MTNWKIISVRAAPELSFLRVSLLAGEQRTNNTSVCIPGSSPFSIQLVNNLFLYNSPNYHKSGKAWLLCHLTSSPSQCQKSTCHSHGNAQLLLLFPVSCPIKLSKKYGFSTVHLRWHCFCWKCVQLGTISLPAGTGAIPIHPAAPCYLVWHCVCG